MAIFVMLRKWSNSSVAWSDLFAWTIVQCGKKPQSGGERSETSAVRATSVARKHKKRAKRVCGANERNSPRADREERASTRRVWSERETHSREGKGVYKAYLCLGGGKGPPSQAPGAATPGMGGTGPHPWTSATAEQRAPAHIYS